MRGRQFISMWLASCISLHSRYVNFITNYERCLLYTIYGDSDEYDLREDIKPTEDRLFCMHDIRPKMAGHKQSISLTVVLLLVVSSVPGKKTYSGWCFVPIA